ncbi:MAG: 4-hydroxy-tetrahydrodipicolinate synthase, partial [Oscillospiraceae bacterium]
VDFEALGRLIEFQIENGTDAIIICGTTGEASTQTIPEHLETIDYCVRKVAGRVKVIAGTGSNDTAHAVLMSNSAEKSGADALLMVTPYYNKTTQRGLINHFEYIADRVNIPIILYNVPSRTGMSFTAESYAALSKHPNINGVKEASGNFTLILKTRAICGDDFYIWSGNDDQIVPIMSLGGLGVISVAANIIPEEIALMTHHCLEGNFKEAEMLQIRYADLIEKLFIETNPIPIKEAMNLMGMGAGELRMPLIRMSEENRAKLIASMKNVGLL